MFGSIGNIVGSSIDAGVSMYNARQAQKHQEKMFKHRYQWQTQDMRKAGINPMLSISQSPPGAGASPQAAPSDIGGSVSRGIQAKLANEQMKTQQTQQGANIEAANVSNAQAAMYRAQAQTAQFEAEQKALAQRHWLDDNQGAFLSSAKAANDAGLDFWSKRGASVGGGIADRIGRWWDNRQKESVTTNAKQSQELTTSQRMRAREKARKVRGDQPYSKDSISHFMERQ